jgi:pimeloyl-ACP methyl ester carboxylesterase
MSKIIDHPLITGFLFYPRPLRRDDFPEIQHGSIHTFASGPSGDQDMISAYWYKPLKDAPTLLMFHGNGEVITDYLYDFHLAIEAIGANYAVVDYRGYGLSQGRPGLSAILEDSHAAWSYFTGELGLKASEIILMGRSLGSIPGLELASTSGRDCRGVIIESGIAGFHRWIERVGPMIERMGLDFEALKQALLRDLDHQAKVRKINRPMLIMHTENDQIVPSWNARDLYSWADPNRTTLNIFPQGDHNTIFFTNAREYFQSIAEFIRGLKDNGSSQ